MIDFTSPQELARQLRKAESTIEYQAREIKRLEDAIAVWRKHAYEVGKLLEAAGQSVRTP